MPPVATAAARSLSSSPSFASISTLSIHLGLSLFLFPSPAKLREPSAFSFRLTPLLCRACSLANPLHPNLHRRQPILPLSPRKASTGLQNRQSPLLTQPLPFRRSFSFRRPLVWVLALTSTTIAFPPPFPLLIPVVSKREQRWRKTKQLSEGARNSRSPFYRDEIDPRAHRRGMLDPFCRVSTRRHPSRGWVGAENEGEQAVVAVSAVRGHE